MKRPAQGRDVRKRPVYGIGIGKRPTLRQRSKKETSTRYMVSPPLMILSRPNF